MARREDGRFLISYSEAHVWHQCPHRWRAFYERGAKEMEELNPPSQALAWGSSFHDCVELSLMGEEWDWSAAWEKELEKLHAVGVEVEKKFRENVEAHTVDLINGLPEWLEEQFGRYEVLETEMQFDMPISNLTNLFGMKDTSKCYVKGYVDAVIVDGRGKYHILDWKTSAKGWSHWKRRDETTPYQIQIYKAVLMAGMQAAGAYVDLKEHSRKVGASYVIVRPKPAVGFAGKEGKSPFELYPVSAGPKSMENAVKWLHKCAKGMNLPFFPKDPTSCMFCPLSGRPEWCDVPPKLRADMQDNPHEDDYIEE